jgi:hypothetical protein
MQPRAPLERSKVRISVAILVTVLGILGLIGGLTASSARAKTAAAQPNGGGTQTPFGTPTWTNTPVPTAVACGL